MRKLIALISLCSLLSFAGLGLVAHPVYAATQPPATTLTTADSPDILVGPVQGAPVTKQLATRAKSTWPWYVTRASGLVAAASLVVLILSGVGLITGLTFKFLEPLTAWATHKALGYVFGLSVVLHIVALLFDKYASFNIVDVLVPFASHHHPLTISGYHFGSLYVALGVFAFYIILAILISSLLWIDKKPYPWKTLHFYGYLAMALVFFHALYLGTDLTHGFFRVLWIIFGVSIAVAIVYRLRRARST